MIYVFLGQWSCHRCHRVYGHCFWRCAHCPPLNNDPYLFF